MIDFHSHILPGIDDGPADIEESVAMAQALREAGFKTIYCTPHLIKGCFDADKQGVLAAVSTLQARLNKDNIEMEILPGREYYLDEFIFDYLQNPMPLGETNFIMLEIPENIPQELIKETCFKIKCSGFTPMIAHPERGNIFAIAENNKKGGFNFFNPEKKTGTFELLDYLIDLGCAFQGNLGSFDGFYGPEVRQIANYLKKKEIFTHFGTDAHSLRSIKRLVEDWKLRGLEV